MVVKDLQEFPKKTHFSNSQMHHLCWFNICGRKNFAWDHNTDNEYRMSMTFIQRVIFIHNEFKQTCGGDRSKVDADFWKQCCMEIGFPIKDENVKYKGFKGSDALRTVNNYFMLTFRTVDNYFMLAIRMRPIWDLINEIFNMWENIDIKSQNVKNK